jgi:GMP synthase (glutamine-hydrolysing)
MSEKIVIYDFGSQYTQLITRKVRELSVYSEIVPPDTDVDSLGDDVIGIILSGGPGSVHAEDAIKPQKDLFDRGLPLLGICYGHHLIAQGFGGEVQKTKRREYGLATLEVLDPGDLFEGIEPRTDVWMSHGDSVTRLPEGFVTLAKTESARHAAIGDARRKVYGVQFHPEVAHTVEGKTILRNFLFRVCGAKGDWSLTDFVERAIEDIRERTEGHGAILGLSGGVDSGVLSELLHRAIPGQFYPIFVDTGLMKRGEAERIGRLFGHLEHLTVIDVSERVFEALKGISEPEKKRVILGNLFGEEFFSRARALGEKVQFLAQGTLYPDVIESGRGLGPSAVIKTHHNVGGLPEDLPLKLIEPFNHLFKDEVREVGRLLDLPDEVIERHPFPGPGFAIRVLGEVTRERVELIGSVDVIIDQEIRQSGLYNDVWQLFPVLLPVRSVGVMGDRRTYENVVAIRAVTSLDGMTADWARLPDTVLQGMATRIVNEIPGVNRVVYDITQKPPGTIEWE